MSRELVISLSLLAAIVAVGAVGLGLRSVSPPAEEAKTQQGSSSPVTASGSTQVSDGGAVQVQVTFDPQSAGKGDAVSFLISMNTHSVELGAFDLATLSQIIVDQGAPLKGVVWTPKAATNGHHVEGTLTAPDPNGLARSATSIVLKIKGLPGPDVRRFEWQVPGR